MSLERILATSARLRVDDLDWRLAREAGLTDGGEPRTGLQAIGGCAP
jgi:hypothetical protein